MGPLALALLLVVAVAVVGAGVLLTRHTGGGRGARVLDLRRQSITFGHAQSPGGGGDRQDAFGFHDPGDTPLLDRLGLVGVVADGFGGPELGAAAASAAVSRFLDAVRKAADDVARGLSARDVLRLAVAEADAAVREVAARAPEERVGAALAAIAAGPGGLHWVSVGDSRIYLLRAGYLHQVTVDHTFRTLLARSIARGQLSPADAAAKKERDALTCALGLGDNVEFDASARPFPLERGDRILVCSAGLHRALDAHRIAAIASESADSCSKRLLAAATSESPGSVTVIDIVLQTPDGVVSETAPAMAARPRTGGESRLIARGGTTQPSEATAS